MKRCFVQRLGCFVLNNQWIGALIMLLVLMFMCTGCGHSMLVMNKNVGLLLRFPVGEANYIGFGIGSTEATVAAVRGGTSFESTTSAGGGVFSGSGAHNNITCFRSNLQFNEGNLRDAFVSPDIPMEVKLKLAEGVVEGSKAPKFPDSIVTTRDVTMQLGDKAVASNAVAVTKLEPTGIDKIVDKTPAIVDSVTKPVTSTVHDLVNPLEGTVSSITNVTKEVKEVINDASNTVAVVVKDTSSEVNTIVDKVNETVDKSLDKTQKTIVLVVGGFGLCCCVVLIIMLLRSLFRSKHPNHHKAHIQSCSVDIESPPLSNNSEEPEPAVEVRKTLPLNWFQKFRLIIMSAVLAIVGLLGWIPKPVLNQAKERLKEAWEEHKAEKKKK